MDIKEVECEKTCLPCPINTLKEGKTFFIQIPNLPTLCTAVFDDWKDNLVNCTQGITVTKGNCEQAVEVKLCEGTPSEQTLTCCLALDYLKLTGSIEIWFNIEGSCISDCVQEPVPYFFHAITTVDIDELCYYCDGTAPDISQSDLCLLFDIKVINVDANGVIEYTVQFIDCPPVV